MSRFQADPPKAMLSAINLVPLVGVLAVLSALFLVGTIPGRTVLFTDEQRWGCVVCTKGSCKEAVQVSLYLSEGGLVTIDGEEFPVDRIDRVIRPPAPGLAFTSLNLDISASPDAEYADVMGLVSRLKSMGLGDHQIHLSSWY